MQAKDLPFKPYCFPAIVEPIGGDVPFEGQRVRLLYETGSLEAITWIALPAQQGSSPLAADVTVVELPSRQARYLMMRCDVNATLSAIDLLNDSVCPISGVITQTRSLIAGIKNSALRAMVVSALTMREATLGYWTTPASLCDHHNFPGGLAKHSLEIATMVACSTALPSEDRDIGIALALLHDYGKIWCYRDGKYTAEHKRGHELVGREKLKSVLDILCAAAPAFGAKMVELLGGPSERANTRYPLAIGKIVKAFDQMSCEMTRSASDELENIPF